jgi:signal transduction histidine kinase
MWIEEIPSLVAALAPAQVAFWPLLSGVGATAAAALREGRRRTALNERLHEVRRPLQALALMSTPGGRDRGGEEGPIEMAAAALARLELEINGGRGESDRAPIAVRPLLEAARRRWGGQAALVGAELALRWRAGEAVVEGDRIELAAALDNLIANAFEHGGPRIELVADDLDGRICLAVVDSGRGVATGESRGRERVTPFERLSGHARHGHGLRLVRRTATRHGGAFALHFGERGTSAVLELPLAPRPANGRAPRSVRREVERRHEIAIHRVRPAGDESRSEDA